ncbi:MAG: UDP-N-acetylmuramoyl-L-alanine--D-glutamate ligase [Pseudomonadota bacterium]|nr:UDP-N-acetylmuramoyl-L-alanine--D-glutamate ligase [Pseudomonadota bacterium]
MNFVNNLANKNALVLGLGDTGWSLVRWLSRQGARVRVADTRAEPPRLADLRRAFPAIDVECGVFAGNSFEDIDLIAISPGVPIDDALIGRARARRVAVVGDIELFAQALARLPPRQKPKILAVTGSNGKTTVTAMLGAMCRAAGLKTEVAGNIAPPALDALMRCEDQGSLPQVWVLELSSFQLETTASLNADAAVVLNLSEDHLDRYAGMRAYAAAKARIFQGSGIQVLNRDDDYVVAMKIAGRRHITFSLAAPASDDEFGVIERVTDRVTERAVERAVDPAANPVHTRWLAKGEMRLLGLDELRVAGLHNAANALAAFALCRAIDLPLAPLQEALREFKGLPHRVEKVAEIAGVTFYDDSKGTNVGATVAALNGLGQGVAGRGRIVLIAGGDGKGQDFAPLAQPVHQHARAVVLIGRDRDRLAAAFAATSVDLRRADDMQQAVELAFETAHCGDAVLLSPACASFDMFRDYRHRAEAFCAAVEHLRAVRSVENREKKCSTRR